MTASHVLVLAMVGSGAWMMSAAEPFTLSTPGIAVSGQRSLPAEIRGVCREKGSAEVDFAVTFKTIAEADSFFPLATYEGPDGKSAPMAVLVTKTPKAVTFNFKSAAGWFGVKNDYLLSLRPADTLTFLKQAAESSSVSVTIAQGTNRMVMTFDKPGDRLAKLQAACKK